MEDSLVSNLHLFTGTTTSHHTKVGSVGMAAFDQVSWCRCCWYHARARSSLSSRQPVRPEPLIDIGSDHAILRGFRGHMRAMASGPGPSSVEDRVAQLVQHARDAGVLNLPSSSLIATDHAPKMSEAAVAWMEDLCALVRDVSGGPVRIPAALLRNMARIAGMKREVVVPPRRKRQACRYVEDRALASCPCSCDKAVLMRHMFLTP